MATVGHNMLHAHISSEIDHPPQGADVLSNNVMWYIGSTLPLSSSANGSSLSAANSHSYSRNSDVVLSDRPGMHTHLSDEQYPNEDSSCSNSSGNGGIHPSSPVPIHRELNDSDKCRGKEGVVIDTPNLSPNPYDPSPSHERGLPGDPIPASSQKTDAEDIAAQPVLQDNSNISDVFSSSILNLSSSDESYETTSPNYRDEDALKKAYRTAIAVPEDDENSRTPSPRPPNKKLSSWYQQSLARSYRAKVHQFQRIFKNTPVDTNRLLVDYSCALSKSSNGLLLQGRMYITEDWICFYSKIIYEQKIFLAVKDVVLVTKAKTARVIPNAIQITVSAPKPERYFFTSFAARERTYAILKKVCQNCHGGGVSNMEEILCQVQDVYGDESLAVLDCAAFDESGLYNDTQFENYPSSSECDLQSDFVSASCVGGLYHRPGYRRRRHRQHNSRKKSKLLSAPPPLPPPPPPPPPVQDTRLSKSSLYTAPGLSRCASLGNCAELLSSHPVGKNAGIVTGTAARTVPKRGGAGISAAFSDLGVMTCSSGSYELTGGSAQEAEDNHTSLSSGELSESDTTDDIEDTPTVPECWATASARGAVFNFEEDERSLSPPLPAVAVEHTHRRKRHPPSGSPRLTAKGNNGPVSCGGSHTHNGRVYADTAINLSVDALFACLFTDSQFFAQFCKHRGTFDVLQSTWPPKPWPRPPPEDGEEAFLKRTISYTLSLKQRLGPRTCSALEQQTLLLRETIPGVRYVVDAKVTNEAVPLCNCFHVVSRYCLLRKSTTVSHLKICSEVVYDKPVFFGAKNIIESTCKSSLTDNFTDLVNQLFAAASHLSDKERLTGGALAAPQDTQKKHYCEHQETSTLAYATDAASRGHRATVGPPTAPGAGKGDLQSAVASSTGNKAFSGVFSQHLQVTGGQVVPNAFSIFTGPTGHSDRSWLFVIAMSLILCVCLSIVYNRFLQLEQWAYRMEFVNRRSPTSDSVGQALRSPAAPEIQSVCSEELESLRLLVKSVSQVMDQMQKALEVLERRVESLTPSACQTR